MNSTTTTTITPARAAGPLPWDDPAFELDPYPWYAQAQVGTPVYQDDDGTYVVLRYDDVVTWGKHPTMSVEPGWDQAGAWSIASSTIIGRDDPDHRRLRRQTNRWFTPKLVREWSETTAEVTSRILDSHEGAIIDGWNQIAVLPTHETMCRVLGVETGPVDAMTHAMAQTMPMLAARPKPGTRPQAVDGFAFIEEFVRAQLDAKRRSPGDGLIDALIAGQDAGEISENEATATAVLLFGLGHMDAGYLVAAGLRIFAEHPHVYEEFRTNPEQREAIINEIARYDPPELSFYRTTADDITIRDVLIPAGSTVRFMIAAANRDPDHFDDPQQFDAHRPAEKSRNLSFGLGTHSCIGQVLARTEAQVIFETLASRYVAIQLAEPIQMDNTDFSRHYTRLQLKLEENNGAH